MNLYVHIITNWIAGAAGCVLCFALPAFAAPPSTNPNDALGLLETHCIKCHGGEKTKGGLDLTTREALLRGGESGPAIVIGKPEASLLLQTIRYETDPHMPHKEKKLPDAEIATFATWLQAGAKYDRALSKGTIGAPTRGAAGFAITEADRAHWAFVPVRPQTPPMEQKTGSQIANPIDQFILSRLQSRGLKMSPPADKGTLIRRVTLDLIGLPPTPAEVDAFVNDASPDAYGKLLDRLLTSPHYGERWGRHWLDLVRFAETDGFEYDTVRPNAWRYRDYVIRSFNADKPYDRFLREQVAGDELWPTEPDALIATGFNLLGPDMVDSSDQPQRRHNTLNDMTDTTALAFLGLTLGCARCHDHKFEPISQRDYYSLQAFFTGCAFQRERPILAPGDRAIYDAAMAQYSARPALRELAALDAPVREALREKKLAKLSPEAQAAHRTPPDERNAEQANLVLETEEMLHVQESAVIAALTSDAKAKRQALADAVKKLPKPPALPTATAIADGKNPVKTFVLFRGEYSQPGEEVRAAAPEILTPRKADVGTGRRSELANWLASPENPLTARVMVNRIWQHHFGRGLVRSPSDFGTHGQEPTHPELLDWLAGEFVAHGWSIKQMHKLILMSATYQQTSSPADLDIAQQQKDPDNRLYWRMNRQRLEGEVIRDSLLAVSGQLNEEMGGPGIFPPIPEDLVKQGAKGWTASADVEEQHRRSIYIFAKRNLHFPFLEVFDSPDSNLSCPVRERSTTAPQSLTLLNADEVMTASRIMAARLEKEAGADEKRIALAYRLALGRAPRAREITLSREFLSHAPLSELCRAVFNMNDFVYVE